MGIERLPEFWPEWKVLEVIGKGAYGKVYKAIDETAGFPSYSAIKVISIPSDDAETDALRSEGMTVDEVKSYFKEIADDFVKEIKVMNTLKGAPNIVYAEAYNILEKKDGPGWDIFIRMELLTSFKDYLDQNTPTEEDVINLGIDIASALEVCQEDHIIHRDIKPANIFVTKFGNYKLGDFGIAKELEKTTGAVSSKGTLNYMAPEVSKGVRYDSTVDIYSLGLVMYSLLNNNRMPFLDPHASQVGYNDRLRANEKRLAGERLPAPCNASGDLSNLILTACAYDPQRRFRNASALKNALISYKANAYGTKEERHIPISSFPANADSTITVGNIRRKNDMPIDWNFFVLGKKKFQGNLKKGTSMVFGRYMQNSLKQFEPIEWIVLNIEKEKALLVSRHALAVLPYNERYGQVTWEHSTLRKWLNFDFFDVAFDSDEKRIIEPSLITNKDNPQYQTPAGNDTVDRVFLLSIDEVSKYFAFDKARECKLTNYCVYQKAYGSRINNNCWWWLRSPGIYDNTAAYVNSYGSSVTNGRSVDTRLNAVRPAMWINIE